jgi:hypothetical protein
MKGSIGLLGRGLLVLALSGYVIGCGDDGGGGGGGEGGTTGGGGSGGGGTGGGGTGGGGTGGGEADTGMPDVTVAQCVDMTETATGGMIMPDCPMCICEAGLDQAVACAGDAMCWPFISCFSMNCDVTEPDMMVRTMCATTNCMSTITGATNAAPLGMVIAASCVTECRGAPPVGDGGDAN